MTSKKNTRGSMVSKIIQKEKERQEELILELSRREAMKTSRGVNLYTMTFEKLKDHKQSIINLKEYMEGVAKFIKRWENEVDAISSGWEEEFKFHKQTKEDIQELKEMIKKYE